MKLGVCYYPEHWPKNFWREDAARMAEIGIKRVRIGEFAWSRLESAPGVYDWAWLDEAIEVLTEQGLEVVLSTPTATPPKWLIDQDQDILATDRRGAKRGFGSRRHYDFSSQTYRVHARRIVTAMAQRYGEHPAVVAWQTDNEYGCHDTVESYSAAAAAGFRRWLEARYGRIEALNAAWGNVFWSMEYSGFDQIDPPNLAVTETNPSHRMDFQRFSSDQVVSFNKLQSDILRRYSPGRDILHNFMGFFTAFDHYEVGRDLDAATWDSYPLGFLEQGWWGAGDKNRFARQGHPDIAAFHHDLYRGVCGGRWQVMEQQPGPVNWAPHNPSPLAGMVRLWSWEAFAHGAEVVSYFRWRQAPFAQEQMHAGLLRPDSSEDWGAREARQTAAEIARLGPIEPGRARVALLFDYAAKWALDIQRQGGGFDYFRLCFDWYGALRRMGLDIDILSPEADISGYALVVAPSLPIVSEALAARLEAGAAILALGPRSGSKTVSLQIVDGLPTGPLHALTGVRVERVESLRPGLREEVSCGGAVEHWREHLRLEGGEALGATADGAAVWSRRGRVRYLGGWADETLLAQFMAEAVAAAGLAALELPDDLRVRRMRDLTFCFNYGLERRDLTTVWPEAAGFDFRLGGPVIGPGQLAAWAH